MTSSASATDRCSWYGPVGVGQSGEVGLDVHPRRGGGSARRFCRGRHIADDVRIAEFGQPLTEPDDRRRDLDQTLRRRCCGDQRRLDGL